VREMPVEVGVNEERMYAADMMLREMVEGSAAYNAPDSMYVGTTEIIRLVIAPNISPSELQDSLRRVLPSGEDLRGADILISDVMSAEVRGVGFDIDPSGPQERAISAQRETSWIWQVTAREKGPRALILNVDAHVEVRGRAARRPLRQFEDTIYVVISPEQRAQMEREAAERERAQREREEDRFWTRLKNFWWLGTAVLIPPLFWLYKRLNSGQTKKPKPRSGKPGAKRRR